MTLPSPPILDALVIGAGFGGLAAALTLAEGGARVAICETLRYPGGCASTFQKDGASFEAGATLFDGFGPGQLFDTWIRRHDIDVGIEALDPVLELRAPGLRLPVAASREAHVAALCALPGAPVPALRSFFAEQAQVAETLWSLFDDPTLLPPFDWSALRRHLSQLHRYAPLLRLVGRPLRHVVARHGLGGFAPLRIWLDAVCQITVQASSDEAEAPFALAAMDYTFRGASHVRGGIGQLAWGLLRAAERQGAEVHLASRVRGLRREGDIWVADVRGRQLRARHVVANLLPQALRPLVAGTGPSQRLAQLERRVETGWGAVMLYLRVGEQARTTPHHLELVQDPDRPFTDGNHLFASVSGAGERAPEGQRAVTVSTHVALSELRAASPQQQAARVAAIQARMAEGLATLAPELWERRIQVLPASPRTFARFTGRPFGYVGGVPRRAGLWNYAPSSLRPFEALPGLFLVGDSVFPGQSTLCVALGGLKVGVAVLARPPAQAYTKITQLEALP